MVTMQPMRKGPLRFVSQFERKAGGAELNVAVGCARLGLRVGWISRVGDDEFGRYLSHFLRGEGVDLSQMKVVPGYPTSLNVKEVREDGSGRTFYYRQGTATSTMTVDDLHPDYFKQARLLHITGVFPAIREENVTLIRQAIALAKKHGIKVSFDPNIRLRLWDRQRAQDVLASFLPEVDVLLAGLDEARLLSGLEAEEAMLEVFHGYGMQVVALKKGSDGAVVSDGSTTLSVPVIPAGKVVDTVGAGDGFDAGFLYGWLNGWSLQRTAAVASAIGSMVVGVEGDNEGLPHLDEVHAFLGEAVWVER